MQKKKLDRPVEEILSGCLKDLRAVTESGYWPFDSPAPSSTEVKIKESINRAIANLETAQVYHEQMFGRTGRDPMRCVAMSITEIA